MHSRLHNIELIATNITDEKLKHDSLQHQIQDWGSLHNGLRPVKAVQSHQVW